MKKISEMTVKELRREISSQVKEANRYTKWYRQEVKKGNIERDSLVEAYINRMQLLGSGKIKINALVTGNINFKKKSELQEQLQTLITFNNMDATNFEKIQEKRDRDLNTFNDRYGTNLNNKQYSEIQKFFIMYKSVLNDFGYKDEELHDMLVNRIAEYGKNLTAEEILNVVNNTKSQFNNSKYVSSERLMQEFTKNLIAASDEKASA